jgi:hypothetical protein
MNNSEEKDNKPLSTFKAKLVERVCDGEGTWLCPFVYRFLSLKDASMRLYKRQLQSVSHCLNDFYEGKDKEQKCDLFDRIEQRILEEERSAIYLGMRRQSDEKNAPSSTPRLRDYFIPRFSWALSGASLAAGFLLVVGNFGTGENSPFDISKEIGQMASNNELLPSVSKRLQEESSSFSELNVATSSSALAPLSRTVSSAGVPSRNSGVESSPYALDWVSSEGSVRIMPGLNGNAPVFWVKPRTEVSRREKSVKEQFSSSPSASFSRRGVLVFGEEAAQFMSFLKSKRAMQMREEHGIYQSLPQEFPAARGLSGTGENLRDAD